MGKGYGVLFEMSFSLFLKKNMDVKGILGTLRDALRCPNRIASGSMESSFILCGTCGKIGIEGSSKTSI
jgi:hypothetical protein